MMTATGAVITIVVLVVARSSVTTISRPVLATALVVAAVTTASLGHVGLLLRTVDTVVFFAIVLTSLVFKEADISTENTVFMLVFNMLDDKIW